MPWIIAAIVALLVFGPKNQHSHYCNNCSVLWSHGNWNVGNRQAHLCPQCGQFVGERVTGSTGNPLGTNWGIGSAIQARTLE